MMTPGIEVGDIPTPTPTQPQNFSMIEVGLITPSDLNKKNLVSQAIGAIQAGLNLI